MRLVARSAIVAGVMGAGASWGSGCIGNSSELPGDCLSGAIQTSPVLTVVDAVTGRPLCGAKVVVTGYVVANGGSGPAVETVLTSDASFGDGGESLVLPPGSDNTPSACSYDVSRAPDNFSARVSLAGYRTEDVSNIYSTVGASACAGMAAAPPPQIVVVKLYPDGS